MHLRPTPSLSLPASPNEVRRSRKVILNSGQYLEDLDLWPGDEVWLHGSFVLLGKVNSQGVFVSHIGTLN